MTLLFFTDPLPLKSGATSVNLLSQNSFLLVLLIVDFYPILHTGTVKRGKSGRKGHKSAFFILKPKLC